MSYSRHCGIGVNFILCARISYVYLFHPSPFISGFNSEAYTESQRPRPYPGCWNPEGNGGGGGGPEFPVGDPKFGAGNPGGGAAWEGKGGC
jgi:hypothetical protein